jgi:hypothetical protein
MANFSLCKDSMFSFVSSPPQNAIQGLYLACTLLGESCPSIYLSIINQRKKLRIKSGKSQKKKIFLKIVSHTEK